MPESEVCERCHLAHGMPEPTLDETLYAAELRGCIEAQATAMKLLLGHVGKKGTCDGPNCGAPIYWVTHYNGKGVPYTEAGLNHFVDCPDRDRFRRAKR